MNIIFIIIAIIVFFKIIFRHFLGTLLIAIGLFILTTIPIIAIPLILLGVIIPK